MPLTILNRPRQCAVVLVVALLGACAREPAALTSAVDEGIRTGAIAASEAAMAPADTRAIGEALNGADSADRLLAWSSQQTGNRGAISALEPFDGPGERDCARFTTTLDTYRGVTLYKGQACRSRTDLDSSGWVVEELGPVGE